MTSFTRRTLGLLVAGVLGAVDVAGLASVDSGPSSAPLWISVVDGVLGVLTLVGVGLAVRHRTGRRAVGLVVVTRGLSALSSLPGLGPDVSVTVRVVVVADVLVTALAVLLLTRTPGTSVVGVESAPSR